MSQILIPSCKRISELSELSRNVPEAPMVPVRHAQYWVDLARLDIRSSDSRSLNPVVFELLVPENKKNSLCLPVCLKKRGSLFSLALVISISSSTSDKELEQTLRSDCATLRIIWIQGGHSWKMGPSLIQYNDVF